MKKNILILFVFFCPYSICNAQEDTSKTLEFTVVSTTATYTVLPGDDYLFLDTKNKIKIISSDKKKKFVVTIDNGNITKNSDSIYFIDGLIADTAWLSIYEIAKTGKQKLAMKKQYNVIAYPQLMWNNVKNDSEIRRQMLNGGKFYAIDKKWGKLEVESFKMDIIDNGALITDSVSGNRLSPKMRKYITSMQPGSVVCFKDVRYHTLNGQLRVEPIFRLIIGRDDDAIYMMEIGEQHSR